MNTAPRPPLSVVIHSWLILLGVIALLTISVVTLVSPAIARNSAAYLSAILLVPMVVVPGVLVFLSVDRRNFIATQIVVVLLFGLAGLIGFGVVANVGEALLPGQKIDPEFLVGLAIIGLSLGAYFALAGMAFLRWSRILRANVPLRGL